jgi:hypothetical protein
MNDRKQPDAKPTPPKRRFRLEKLEDRIAPKKGGNPAKKTALCDGDSSTGTSGY